MSSSEPSTELHIVILAAGKGSRMHSSLPKVLHHIAGKPLLGHVLDAATTLSPSKVHVIVGHGKDRRPPEPDQGRCKGKSNRRSPRSAQRHQGQSGDVERPHLAAVLGSI